MKMRQTIKFARVIDKNVREEGGNRFDGLSKKLRKELVSDPGELDFKRFLLSSDPKIREKLKALRNVVNGLSTKYPEIIGLTLFGSQVKGYANNESDIDASIYLDEDKIRNFTPKTDPKEDILKSPRFLGIQDDIAHGTSYAGLKSHSIDMDITSRAKIVRACGSGTFNESIMNMFHLAVGKGIYGYRELVISTMEKMGERGEKAWSTLMNDLMTFENLKFPNEPHVKMKNLYPKTLAEGRKYFLRNAPEKPVSNPESSVSA